MKNSNSGFLQILVSFGYSMITIGIVWFGIRGIVLLIHPKDTPEKIQFRTLFGLVIWMFGGLLYIVILGNIVPYEYFEIIVGWPVIIITVLIIVIGNFICAARNDYFS